MGSLTTGDYDGLCISMGAARGKRLSDETKEMVSRELKKVPWDHACKIVRAHNRMSTPPTNLYGWIIEKVGGTLYELDKQQQTKDQWTAQTRDNLSSEEFQLYWKIHEEIATWHRLGLQQTYVPGLKTPPMNFEDWVIAGRPRSWSPLHDQLLSGGLIAYKKDVSNPNANCTRDFLREFYRQLLDARRKKEEQRFEQAKTVALQKAKEATGAARTEELDFIT